MVPEPLASPSPPGSPNLPPPPAGAQASELPLPGSWPPPSDDAPGPALPQSRGPAVEAASPDPEFDAKAMVESQKRFKPNPTYGEMPAGTPEGRAEAARLRAEANRKRRRNRVIAWIVGIAFAIAIAAVGYLAYRSGQDETGTGAHHSEVAAIVAAD